MARMIAGYEVLEQLGRGAMAKVYLARQPGVERLVALKELGAFYADDEATIKRFLRESKLIGSISHPNVVTVFDAFEHEGTPCIAMEYAEGGSLRRWIGRTTPEQGAGVLEGVLAGLDAAGQRGIVHRDLKPENLLVTADGRTKIADFGIAKASAGETNLTGTGVAVGTPSYMAPEQVQAGQVGPWTDLYALGVIAFELLTGRVPFGGDAVAVLMRHINERPPPVREAAPDVPEALSDWVARLLAKDPAARPASAAAAAEELDEILLEWLGPRWRRTARLLDRPPEADTPRPLTPPPREASSPAHTTPVPATTARTAHDAPQTRVAAPPAAPQTGAAVPADLAVPPSAAAPPAEAVAPSAETPPSPARAITRAGRRRAPLVAAALAALAALAVVAVVAVLLAGGGEEEPRRAAAPASGPQPLGDDWVRGIHVDSYTQAGYTEPEAEAAFKRAQDLGATHVTLQSIWTYSSDEDSELDAAPEGFPGVTEVEAGAQTAKRLGLKVIIQPKGLNPDEEGFVGDVVPEDPDTWWSAYGDMIGAAADVAQSVGADILVIGTTLNGVVSDTDRWHGLVEDVRGRFDGRLTYGADGVDGLDDIGFWDTLDFVGIDGVQQIDRDDTPSPAEVARTWRPNIAAAKVVHEQALKPVLLTSLGYKRRSDALRVYAAEGDMDEDAQARAFEGAFRAWSAEDWVEGIVWQHMVAEGDDADPDGDDFWFRDRPAADVLRTWHGAR